MSDYEIIIRGDDEAIRRLTVDLPRIVDGVLERGAVGMVQALATYPAPPPSSTYVRTGTLGQRWTIGRGDMLRRVGNNTVYAPPVQDRDSQARVHQGRWPTAQGVAEKAVDGMVTDLGARIGEALGG